MKADAVRGRSMLSWGLTCDKVGVGDRVNSSRKGRLAPRFVAMHHVYRT